MGSYAIVKVYEEGFGERYPDMPWEPKVAFDTVAHYYHDTANEKCEMRCVT